LNDLCSSGLVFRTGSGDDTIYGLTQEKERRALAHQGALETTSSLVWLELCRDPESTDGELAARLALPVERIGEALSRLEADGRIQKDGERYSVESLHIPAGARSGWELAVFDHFQTVCVALATKLRRGQARSAVDDTNGGQTVTFEIDDDHPQKEAVLGHLARVRDQTNELWDRVEEHNRHVPLEGRRRVAFYVGQVELGTEDDE
jgi:hypothetical protein